MDYDERLKQLKILQPRSGPDREIVRGFVRRAEELFMDEGPKAPILIRPLAAQSDWDWLLQFPEDLGWKLNKDREHGLYWQEHGKQATALLMGSGGRALDSIAKAQIQAMKDSFLKRQRTIPLRAGQAVIATAGHVIAGFAGYEVLPHGDNPYEPLLSLYELGYVVRRVRTDELNEWRIGYIEAKE